MVGSPLSIIPLFKSHQPDVLQRLPLTWTGWLGTLRDVTGSWAGPGPAYSAAALQREHLQSRAKPTFAEGTVLVQGGAVGRRKSNLPFSHQCPKNVCYRWRGFKFKLKGTISQQ